MMPWVIQRALRVWPIQIEAWLLCLVALLVKFLPYVAVCVLARFANWRQEVLLTRLDAIDAEERRRFGKQEAS